VDWVSRRAALTGEIVSNTELQRVWRLVESVVDIP